MHLGAPVVPDENITKSGWSKGRRGHGKGSAEAPCPSSSASVCTARPEPASAATLPSSDTTVRTVGNPSSTVVKRSPSDREVPW